MKDLSISAIILAAGRSARMGQFKPLLQVGGQTLIQHAIAVFHQNMIEDIIVVTGHRAADLEAALAHQDVRHVRNTSYSLGMFSSVVTGVRKIPARCQAFFILPVDMAFVQSTTISRLIEAFQVNPGRICYPCAANRRGHPPLIPVCMAEAIVRHNGKGGLRQVLKHWEYRALDVAVRDRFILLDLDTPEDLLRLGRME
jgi:CTP:molybdopterin cytidylyltransferase MocA